MVLTIRNDKKVPLFYAYGVVLAGLIITMVMWGTYYSFGVFFNPLLNEFGWTRALVSGAFSLCSVLLGLFGIVTGKLCDKYGPRLVTTICGSLLGVGYFLMSQINAKWQLYLFYGLIIGLGMSGSWIPVASTVTRWFVKRRGMMTGIVAAGIGGGITIMPLVARWLISGYSWRTSYVIVGAIALTVIVLASQFLKRDPAQQGMLPYGWTEMEKDVLDLQAEGLSLYEAVHTRQLWMLFIMYFSYGLWLTSIMVHIVLHAIKIGISAGNGATILVIIGGVSLVGRIIMGSLADRVGNRLVLGISFFLVSISLGWLLIAKGTGSLFLFAVVFGLGYAGVCCLQSPVVAEIFGLSSHGAILGTVVLAYATGGGTGPVLSGYLFDITGSYNVAFSVCAGTAALSAALSFLLRAVRDQMHGQTVHRLAS